MISFTIPGKPVGKERARVVTTHGFTRSFTPEQTVIWENKVGYLAAQAGCRIAEGLFAIHILITTTIPKSYSKKKASEALARRYAMGTPDLDNVAKAVMDGLRGVVYSNDHKVAHVEVLRVYGDDDCTRVDITNLMNDN